MNAAVARSGDATLPAFPWAAAMHFGLGLLRLSPKTFWALSVREFLALGGAMKPVNALGRGELETMMRQWPDGGDDGKQ